MWGRHSIYYGAANVRRTGDNISHFLFSPLIETRQFSLARQLSRVRGVTSNTDTFSGFISVGKEKETQRHLFFWLVLREKEPSLGPLVLHLAGGLTVGHAVFKQTGPFFVEIKKVLGQTRVNLVRNRNSWHSVANMLYVDYTTDTGFSFSSSPGEGGSSVESVTEDLVSFLSQVMELVPHYVPGYHQSRARLLVWAHSLAAPLAVSLVERLARSDNTHRYNLQGLALENPLLNSSLQLGALTQIFFSKQPV